MSEIDNNIVVSFITDNNYTMQTYIAIKSLFENKLASTNYYIYLLGINLTQENINRLLSLQSEKFSITHKKIENDIIQNNVCKNSVYSSSVLCKLMLDKIFPEFDKILFLDSDTIVLKDLSELYNIDVQDYYIGGVKDIYAPLFHILNHKKINYDYFNTGVMVLNLKKIREENFFEKALSIYLKNPEQYYFPEQDVLNEIINKKIKIISTRYNFITSSYRYTKTQLSNFFKEDFSDFEPVILHYAGGCRPWIYYNIYFSKAWEYFYNKSIYAKTKLKKKYIPFIKLWIFILNQIKIMSNKKIYKIIGYIK